MKWVRLIATTLPYQYFFQFFRPLSFLFKHRIKYRVRRQFRWKFGWVYFGDNFCWVCCQNWHWTKSNRRVSARSRRKFTAAKIPPSIGSIWWYTAILICPTFYASYNQTKNRISGLWIYPNALKSEVLIQKYLTLITPDIGMNKTHSSDLCDFPSISQSAGPIYMPTESNQSQQTKPFRDSGVCT